MLAFTLCRRAQMLCGWLLVAACGEATHAPTTMANVSLMIPQEPLVADSTLRVPIGIIATGEFNPRVATLRVSSGEFFPGGATTIVIPLDGSDHGQTVLRPPAQPGLITVTATAGRVSVVDSMRFIAPPPVIEFLSISDSTPFADEVTQVRIEARLTESRRRNISSVKFGTTAGQFVGGDKALTAIVDHNGTASAVLTSPAVAQRVDVWVEAAGEIARCEIAFQLAPPWLVSIAASVDSLPADGASIAIISISRDPAAGHIANVALEASVGAFLPSGQSTQTVPFDGTGRGAVAYRAGTMPQVVLLKATKGSQTIQYSLPLTTAFPDAISLTGSTQTAASVPETLTFSSRATRSIGTVSSGLAVHFSAHRGNGTPIGTFLSIPVTDGAGQSSVGFVLNDPTYTGDVLITARMQSANGQSIAATHILRVKP